MSTLILTDSANGMPRAGTPEPVLEIRQLRSWINAYVDYTEHLPSPELFRKWAAIAGIAGACERRVWANLMGMQLFPNMYVLLTSRPGVGKGVVINPIESLWRSVPSIKIAPTTMTKAALIDELNDSRRVVTPGPGKPVQIFHSLQVPATEFGNLCPAYDQAFMNVLTDIYDCRDSFEERTRMKGERLKIAKPQMTILGGSQPDYLSALLPEVAWGQGFMSRVLIIFSDEDCKKPLFTGSHFSPKLRRGLEHDINRISQLTGEFLWADGVGERLDEWYLSGGEPRPTHMRLANYNTRRHVHLTKLCMIYSIARTDTLIVDMEDYDAAMATLLEAEQQMPLVFRAMISAGDSAVIHDATGYVTDLYNKTKLPVPEREIVKFLHQRVPGREVLQILELMQNAGFIEQATVDIKGKGSYKPFSEKPDAQTQVQERDNLVSTKVDGHGQ